MHLALNTLRDIVYQTSTSGLVKLYCFLEHQGDKEGCIYVYREFEGRKDKASFVSDLKWDMLKLLSNYYYYELFWSLALVADSLGYVTKCAVEDPDYPDDMELMVHSPLGGDAEYICLGDEYELTTIMIDATTIDLFVGSDNDHLQIQRWEVNLGSAPKRPYGNKTSYVEGLLKQFFKEHGLPETPELFGQVDWS